MHVWYSTSISHKLAASQQIASTNFSSLSLTDTEIPSHSTNFTKSKHAYAYSHDELVWYAADIQCVLRTNEKYGMQIITLSHVYYYIVAAEQKESQIIFTALSRGQLCSWKVSQNTLNNIGYRSIRVVVLTPKSHCVFAFVSTVCAPYHRHRQLSRSPSKTRYSPP